MADESESLWCEACAEERPSHALFCQKCGAKVTVRVPDRAPVVKPEKPALPSKESGVSAESPRLAKKKLIIGASIVAALVIAGGTYGVLAVIEQQREEQLAAEATAAAETEKRRAEAETLLEAFGRDQVMNFLPSCEEITGLVSADEEKWEAAVSVFDGVSDPREASRVLSAARSANGTLEDADVQAYSDGFEKGVAESIAAVFDSSNRDEKAPVSQIERWESEWIDFTREACPEEFEMFDATYSSLQASAEKFSRMTTLASQVPWYPEGFSPLTTDVAIDWVDGAGNNCYSCIYWTLDVVSKTSCSSGLYVEVNISDPSGRVVDWTNDSLPYLESYQVGRLAFESYLGGRASSYTASVVDIRC